MTTSWPLIDAQVHAYERNHPGRPWIGHLHGPPEVTGEQLVAAMDAVGVDGALLVSPWSMYRYDASYACAVQARHPERFALEPVSKLFMVALAPKKLGPRKIIHGGAVRRE